MIGEESYRYEMLGMQPTNKWQYVASQYAYYFVEHIGDYHQKSLSTLPLQKDPLLARSGF